jgi:uncharacterized protein (DUF1501 family)
MANGQRSRDARSAAPSGTGVPLTRRDVLRYGLCGAGAVLLTGRAGLAAEPPVKAKSVIQIWLAGGPAHLDSFDPKPEAGNDYCGPLNNPIATNVGGIRIGELLPLLAKQADKYSLIRSMTHGDNGHETAAYLTQTGRRPGDRLVYPCAGAVVSLFKGYDAGYNGLIPPYIVLTQSQGRFSEAGFLGPRHMPFATGGDPVQQRFAVEGVVSPGISDQQQQQRRELLRKLDTLGAAAEGHAALTAFYQSEEQAYDMILGDGAKAFDLSQETDEVRASYDVDWGTWVSRTRFGQSCLAARRLVERGVPYITINWGGWDSHTDNFRAMRQLLPDLDRGLSTLLTELSQRGLLESTIVWCCGEFGRTPKIDWGAPWNGGRNHHGKVFSALVAGGGFQGGQIVGASDAKGEDVQDRPVYPCDLLGSIYQLMGIDPEGKLANPMDMPLTVTPAAGDGIPMAGRLNEIM